MKRVRRQGDEREVSKLLCLLNRSEVKDERSSYGCVFEILTQFSRLIMTYYDVIRKWGRKLKISTSTQNPKFLSFD